MRRFNRVKKEGGYRAWKIRSYSSAYLWRQSRDFSRRGYGSKSREKCIQLGCVRCSEGGPYCAGLTPHPLARWNSAIIAPKGSLCYRMRLNWSDDSGSFRLRFSAARVFEPGETVLRRRISHELVCKDAPWKPRRAYACRPSRYGLSGRPGVGSSNSTLVE
jgi:hypothetical protein